MKRLIMVCALTMPHSLFAISQEYLDEGPKRLNLSQLEYNAIQLVFYPFR